MVVFGLGKNLLFKYVLGCCDKLVHSKGSIVWFGYLKRIMVQKCDHQIEWNPKKPSENRVSWTIFLAES